MIGASLLLFLFAWQAYLWPLPIVTDFSLSVAPVALARFFGHYGIQYGQPFARSVILTLIPVVLLFAFRMQFG